MTSLLVLGAVVSATTALATLLSVVCRRFLGGPPPAPRQPRGRFTEPQAAVPRDPLRSRSLRGRRLGGRRTGPVLTQRRPVQVVAADLRRLSRELATVPAGAPFVRWQALQNAYDRVLVEAAEELEVQHSLTDLPMGSAREVERLRVVCALEAAGLVVQG